jgi:predicted GTPase
MTKKGIRKRVVIMGAAGRDFHDFNMLYRDDPAQEVVAFTATQVPGIENRCYPASLAGPLYPEGIPIRPETALDALLRDERIDAVVFAYSDIGHDHVMHVASRVLAAGAEFVLPGPARTMLRSTVPVIAVSAVRTGCGKSQTARWLSRRLKVRGLRTAAIRHPMPYGDLARQAVQRFETVEDLAAADCTIEEREEYEPHIAAGNIVFAGVDYARILVAAEAECDVILWDGGNNDMPFLRPDLHIVLADARRPGHETSYFPGEAVLRMADIVVIAKTDVAAPKAVETVAANVARIRPGAPVVRAASPVALDDPDAAKGKRVLVVEDGPTVTHGGLPDGAGVVAARAAGVAEIVDPRPFAAPIIRAVYDQYPHIGAVLPAVGYGADQLAGLRATIEAAEVDFVIAATPIDLGRLIETNKPVLRARYEYAEAGEPRLSDLVDAFLDSAGA